MTTLEILRAARELISDPARWTQGAFARSFSGENLAYGNDPRATCWCAYGVLEKISGEKQFYSAPGHTELNNSCFTESEKLFSVPAINDNGTHKDVLALYDRAIALAEQEEDAKC